MYSHFMCSSLISQFKKFLKCAQLRLRNVFIYDYENSVVVFLLVVVVFFFFLSNI